jgi:tetratricopeptide (TPR) repeat protein
VGQTSHIVPKRIGRFRILGLVGEGGMGRVFAAEDEALQRRVAIKVLKGGDDSSHRRFLREARIAARISHPNVCSIFEVGEQGGIPFLATELLAGETLAKRIERGALSVDEVLVLARDMLAALGALHEAGIVHRDVKPSNVFLTPHGVKLLDFGIARPLPSDVVEALATGGEITRPGGIVGTPSYMAPEQILGRPLDGRADLFAAGVVFYEALTGGHPFPGENTIQVLSAILHEQPLPLTEGLGLFDAVLRRVLAKPPELRYETAREMADALGAAGRAARSGAVGGGTAGEVFVGRQKELAWLEERMAAALAGMGSVVFVTGEAGVGKSALMRELRRRVRSVPETVSVSMGRCLGPQGPGEPFQPFIDATHRLLIGRGRARTLELIRECAPTVGVTMPIGLVPDPDGELRRQTAGATKQRYYREAGDFIEMASRDFPILCHLEDLQWADPATIECLHHIGCRISRRRVLIVCTYRHSDVDAVNAPLKRCVVDLVSRGAGRELALGALSRDDVRRYLDARFPANSFPDVLADTLHARTEGHPLFARSLVDFLQEQGRIVREGEGWILDAPVESLQLEPSRGLQALVRQRVEALPEIDQELLRLGSVCGRDFLSSVVAHLAGLEEGEAEERLSRLCTIHRLILDRGERELPDGNLAVRYRFAHALYQEALYQELVPSRRVQLHRQVAERMKKHWGDEAPVLAAELAQHCEQGRDFAEAVEFRLHAGDTAVRRFAYDEAEAHFEWASRLVEKLPPAERPVAEIEVHRRRGALRYAQGHVENAVGHFEAMLSHTREIGCADAEREALGRLCDALFLSTRPAEEMAAHVRALLDLSTRKGEAGHVAEARGRLGQVMVSEGRFIEAIPVLEDAIREAQATGTTAALQIGLSTLGFVDLYQGAFAAAEECFVEARALATDRGDGVVALIAASFEALSKALRGRVSEGLDDLEEAVALARRDGDRFVLPRLLSLFGLLHRQLFALDQAREFFLEALRLAPETQGVWAPAAEPLAFLSVDEVRLGNHEGAVAALADLHGLLTRTESHRSFNALRFESWAAEHWAARQDWEHASRHATQALAIAARLGAREFCCAAERIRAEAALAEGQDLEEPARRVAEALEALGGPVPFEAWKAARLLGLLHRRLGDETRAQCAFAEAAQAVRTIAAGVEGAYLRSGFLEAPPVKEVLQAVPGPEEEPNR